jgi:cell division transport system permease protein
MLHRFKKSSERLGLAPATRDYDLPFDHDPANRFLVMLIGFMTYLAVFAATSGLMLTGMGDRWTSDLARNMTIEIPSVDDKGKVLGDAVQQDRVTKVLTVVGRVVSEDDITVKSPRDVAKLVEPWLGGGDKILGQVPLPTLVRLSAVVSPERIDGLKTDLATIGPDIRLETHQGWLDDVVRLTGTLSWVAYLIGIVTILTTVFAISGAVRARMAAYAEQLEILHLMGATDDYITRQFQKHALSVAVSGAGAGMMVAVFTFVILGQWMGTGATGFVPAFTLDRAGVAFLILIPVAACGLVVLSTRLTVMKHLKQMP